MTNVATSENPLERLEKGKTLCRWKVSHPQRARNDFGPRWWVLFPDQMLIKEANPRPGVTSDKKYFFYSKKSNITLTLTREKVMGWLRVIAVTIVLLSFPRKRKVNHLSPVHSLFAPGKHKRIERT